MCSASSSHRTENSFDNILYSSTVLIPSSSPNVKIVSLMIHAFVPDVLNFPKCSIVITSVCGSKQYTCGSPAPTNQD